MPVNIDYLSENSPKSPYFTDVSRCADGYGAEIQPMSLLTHIEREERVSVQSTLSTCARTRNWLTKLGLTLTKPSRPSETPINTRKTL